MLKIKWFLFCLMLWFDFGVKTSDQATTTETTVEGSGSGSDNTTTGSGSETTVEDNGSGTTPTIDGSGSDPTTPSPNGSYPMYTTNVAVEISETLSANKFQFFCKFETSSENEWFYKVTWYQNDVIIKTFPAMDKTSNIKENTKLLEEMLSTKKVGFQVKCGYSVGNTVDGVFSPTANSTAKFVGIEILTNNVIVQAGGKVDISLRATAPIGCKTGECALHVNVYNPNINNVCTPSATFPECGMYLSNVHWDKPFNLTVSAGTAFRYGRRQRTDKVVLKTDNVFSDHDIWQNYDIGEINISITQDTSQIQGKYCYAVCDPHMRTFERRNYEQQYLGQFTLYENKEWKQEIQIKTEACFPSFRPNSRPFCVCGIAVRAGGEVFVMNKCSPNKYWKIGYTQCDKTKPRLISIRKYGSQYEILLPSGTSLKTNLYTYSKFLNLYVYPSEGDINNTAGLCGRINDAGFFWRNGTEEPNFNWYGMEDFSNSWKVDGDVIDLFSDGIKNLESIGDSIFQCKCMTDPTSSNGLTAQCDKVDVSKCGISIGRYGAVKECQAGTIRKKRSTKTQPRLKRSTTGETEPKNSLHLLYKRAADDGWSGNWTNETATKYCDDLFTNSPAVKLCENLESVDTEKPKENCILDIKLGGDTSFSLVAVETIKNKCFHEVSQNETLQDSSNGSNSIMTQIQAVACPFDCFKQGNCTDGTCVCSSDYGDVDCSNDLRIPPLLDHVENNGHCDLKGGNNSCDEVSVYGGSFIDTSNPLCKVTTKQLTETSQYEVIGTGTHTPRIESIGEVVCSLVKPSTRKRRASTTEPKVEFVNVYEVSVSNNGLSFSDTSLVVKFNSDCQTCTISGDTVTCQYTGDYCISDGACYAHGDVHTVHKCYNCNAKDGNRFWIRSTSDGDCTTPAKEAEKLYWVIGVVLGVVVVVAIVVGVVIYFKKKNKRPVTPILAAE